MASKSRQIYRWNNITKQDIDNIKCFVCDYFGSTNKYRILKAYDMFNAGEIIRYECPVCETIFGDLRFLNLSRDEIQKDYEDVYSYFNEGDTTNDILYILNNIEFCKDKTKKYLDFACGKWNNVIGNMRNSGYDIIGYDKYVTNGDQYIFNSIDGMKFDIIYNSNYIEHLINPISDISEILSYLNKDGYLIFITQCFEYCIENTHYHTFFFNDKSLKIISDKLNITPVYSNKFIYPNGGFNIVKVFKKNY